MALASDALTTVNEARGWLGEDDASLSLLESLINGFSHLVQRHAGRQFKPRETAVAKKFRYDGSGVLRLDAASRPTELVTPTSIVLYSDLPTAYQKTLSAGDASNEADYRLEPRGGTAEGTYTWLVLPKVSSFPSVSGSETPIASSSREAQLTITGSWGADSVPADIAIAVLREIENVYRNRGGFDSRTFGELSISDLGVTPGLPPLSRGTMRIVGQYRAPVFA